MLARGGQDGSAEGMAKNKTDKQRCCLYAYVASVSGRLLEVGSFRVTLW